jgi:hypothetical protein
MACLAFQRPRPTGGAFCPPKKTSKTKQKEEEKRGRGGGACECIVSLSEKETKKKTVLEMISCKAKKGASFFFFAGRQAGSKSRNNKRKLKEIGSRLQLQFVGPGGRVLVLPPDDLLRAVLGFAKGALNSNLQLQMVI